MVPPSDDQLSRTRAAIATAVLDALPPAQLGEIQLWPEQRRIVARARQALRAHGGCLVAEDVGRGKTFVALALARESASPVVVAPAALRHTWMDAAQRAGVPCGFISHEALSRGRAPPRCDGLIVDESHHYRTMNTRRYDVLAAAAARARVVLLSATPLQNRRRDLAAQLALFLGEGAFALDEAQLARFVIRGGDDDGSRAPALRAPEWIRLHVDDSRVLDAILGLPVPPAPMDGGDGGALRTINLVRAWASSRAALESTLRSRVRVATAIEQGVEAGRTPTRRELRAWSGADDAIQLGFASLLMQSATEPGHLGTLRSSVEIEHASLLALKRVLRETPDPDVARVAALRELRFRHRDARLLAFSERAATIHALFAAMRGDAGVGMLTASGACIATGRLPRDELLARFAPRAQRARALPAHESVTLLLTTDLLAEGMNLQDASVVVHLDLPWNPTRLAQRVGRVRRPGGSDEVVTYLLAPPARAAALVDAESRLREKARAAERVLGVTMPVLPPLSHAPDAERRTEDATTFGLVVARLERWLHEPVQREQTAGDATGWLAALSDGRLLCALDGDVREDAASLARASLLAEHHAVPADGTAREEIDAWLAGRQLAELCGLSSTEGALRRTIRRWIDAGVARAPRHERAAALAHATRLREALRHTMPLGAERTLAALAREAALVTALREALGIVADMPARDTSSHQGARVVAVVCFQPPENTAGPAT